MEESLTIRQLLAANKIFVPAYQRGYSWDTESDLSKTDKQVNMFLSDLENHINGSSKSEYYFGHFLFKKKEDRMLGVIDGQQRLITLIILFSVLFRKLKSFRCFAIADFECFEDMIKRNGTYRLNLLDSENSTFRDYVIDRVKTDKNGLITEPEKRIVQAFDYFTMQMVNKEEKYITDMMNVIQKSFCTIQTVKNESEAIQMFTFKTRRYKIN